MYQIKTRRSNTKYILEEDEMVEFCMLVIAKDATDGLKRYKQLKAGRDHMKNIIASVYKGDIRNLKNILEFIYLIEDTDDKFLALNSLTSEIMKKKDVLSARPTLNLIMAFKAMDTFSTLSDHDRQHFDIMYEVMEILISSHTNSKALMAPNDGPNLRDLQNEIQKCHNELETVANMVKKNESDIKVCMCFNRILRSLF